MLSKLIGGILFITSVYFIIDSIDYLTRPEQLIVSGFLTLFTLLFVFIYTMFSGLYEFFRNS